MTKQSEAGMDTSGDISRASTVGINNRKISSLMRSPKSFFSGISKMFLYAIGLFVLINTIIFS
jgi:hypothetical protein